MEIAKRELTFGTQRSRNQARASLIDGDEVSMASSVAIPQARPVNPGLQFLKIVPGVLLLAAVGYAGKLLEANVGKYAKAHHWTFPNIEYVLWAILIGLAISNTVGVPVRSKSPTKRTRYLEMSSD